jgi:hypothetical protein
MARRRKVGRPREFQQRCKLTVLLEAGERDDIQQAAEDAGVSVAAWMRRAALAMLRDPRKRRTR